MLQLIVWGHVMKQKKVRFRAMLSLVLFLSFPFIFLSDSSSGFGKTNFIIGTDSTVVRREKKVAHLERSLHVPDHTRRMARAFFSPDDNARDILLDLIACEQESIFMAAFLLTDAVIAKALIEAKERGIDVQFVTDQMCCKGRHGKVGMLLQGGIDVLVYIGGQKPGSHMSDIMHNKFIIFAKNLQGRSVLWTGSFNFTHSARLKNQENVLLLGDRSIVSQYNNQFGILKTRCVPYRNNMFPRTKKLANKNGNQKKTKKRKGTPKRSIKT